MPISVSNIPPDDDGDERIELTLAQREWLVASYAPVFEAVQRRNAEVAAQFAQAIQPIFEQFQQVASASVLITAAMRQQSEAIAATLGRVFRPEIQEILRAAAGIGAVATPPTLQVTTFIPTPEVTTAVPVPIVGALTPPASNPLTLFEVLGFLTGISSAGAMVAAGQPLYVVLTYVSSLILILAEWERREEQGRH